MVIKLSPRALRVNEERTQAEVAKHLGISLAQYKRKENGHAKWYADEIFSLAELYSVPVTYFFIEEVSEKDTKVKI